MYNQSGVCTNASRAGVSGRSGQANIGFTFSADEACIIEITAQTAEIGDNITIETDGEILEKNCAPVDFESSAPPPFLAPVRPREYYERLLRRRDRGTLRPSICRLHRTLDHKNILIYEVNVMSNYNHIP